MRKGLIVGINHYEHVSSLFGCVDDAHAVKAILDRNGDGTINFESKLLTGTGPNDVVTRTELRDHIKELFADDSDIALFYFAGHGSFEGTGGYILTSDSRSNDGVALTEVVDQANLSKAKNKIIVLDACNSGIAGDFASAGGNAVLSEGLTVLTAATKDQYATEEDGQGVFTRLFVDSLSGVSANLVGKISPGSVYAYIDQSLGAWEQRPVFKTNVKTFVSLREVAPSISLDDLREITKLFPDPSYDFPLDMSYEPEMDGRSPADPLPIEENTKQFAILQKYNRLNLLVPVGEDHMWHAAKYKKSCKLTVLGQHYWRLVNKQRI